MQITIKSDNTEEIELLMNAENLQAVIRDMGNYLRTASDKGDSEELVCISDVYNKLFEIMTDNNINRDIAGF